MSGEHILLSDGSGLVIVIGDQAFTAEGYGMRSSCFNISTPAIDVTGMMDDFPIFAQGPTSVSVSLELYLNGEMKVSEGNIPAIKEAMRNRIFAKMPVLDIIKYVRGRVNRK